MSNEKPSEESLLPEDRLNWEKSNFRHIRFDNEIKSWLQTCAEKAEAPIVRLFIEQLLMHVREDINGERDMDETTEVARIIYDDDSNIKSAVSVSTAWPTVQQKMLKQLQNQIEHEKKSSENAIVSELESYEAMYDGKAYCGFNLCFWDKQDLVLSFEFNAPDYGNLSWGLCRRTDTEISESEVGHIRKLMQEHFVRGGSTQWWPWYAWGSDSEFTDDLHNWSNSPAPWIAIKNGEMVKHFFRLAKKVREIFERSEETKRLLGTRTDPR